MSRAFPRQVAPGHPPSCQIPACPGLHSLFSNAAVCPDNPGLPDQNLPQCMHNHGYKVVCRSQCSSPTPLQVLDTQDLLDSTEDSCWADGHGCRQAGGMLATSASLLDTSSTCLDTSCLDDLMDTVQEDGPFGGSPLAAGAPRGESCSAIAACLIGGAAGCWHPGAPFPKWSAWCSALSQPAWAMLLSHIPSVLLCTGAVPRAEPAAGAAILCTVQRFVKPAQSVLQQAPRPIHSVLSCGAF